MTSDDTPDGGAPKRRLTPEQSEAFKRELFFNEPQAVGYRNPPERSRFRKGQSGNPKGRPKLDSCSHVLPLASFGSSALSLARRKMTVRERGKERDIPTVEAVYLAQIKLALEGNAFAQKQHSIEHLNRIEREERWEIAREHEIAEDYIERARAAIAAAKSRGEPEPEFYPHPDDIVVEPGRRIRFNGPINAEQAEELKEKLAIREALIWQAGLDQRFDPAGADASILNRRVSAEVLALALNGKLPPRLRMEEFWLGYQIDRASRHAKRVILKRVYQQWRKLGARPKRGALFPELWQTLDRYDTLYQIGVEIIKEIRERQEE